MANRLDTESRDILEFRPDIEFVEPDVEPGVIDPVVAPGSQLEDVEERVDQVRKLAEAVNTLAAAVQAKADLRASNMVIKLDAQADAATIQAMRRAYPDADPTEITYSQYRQCKDNQRARGEAIARQVIVTQDDINEARKDAAAEGVRGATRSASQTAGFRTEAARTGGLRPELNVQIYPIPPIDIMEIQDVLIKILVNFIWKNFIKPAIQSAATLTLVGGPVAAVIKAVPDQIVPLPPGFSVPDLTALGQPVLGEQPPKWMTEAFPEIPQDVASAQAQQAQEQNQ